MKFTMNRIDSLTCPEGKKDRLFFDSGQKGLGIRVTSHGGKRFIFQYRDGLKVCRMTLGDFPTISLEAARKAAIALINQKNAGTDPLEAKRQERAERADAQKLTVETLLIEWADARRKKGRSEGYLAPAVGTLRKHLRAFLSRPAATISINDAQEILASAFETSGPAAANHVLAYGRACFGWGADKRTGTKLKANPFAKLEQPADAPSRERVLDSSEIGAIWRAASIVGYPAGPYVKMLLLTLARRNEVAGMCWSEVSADFTIWTLPANRTKNDREHVTKLPEHAQAILRALPKFNDCDYVFPSSKRSSKNKSGSRTAISGFSSFKDAVDLKIIEAEGIPLKPWTFHDFRRSGVTWLANSGFAPHVADKLLNHVSGTISGVAAIYQKAEFQNERAAALHAWATHIVTSADGKDDRAGNIIKLHR